MFSEFIAMTLFMQRQSYKYEIDCEYKLDHNMEVYNPKQKIIDCPVDRVVS